MDVEFHLKLHFLTHQPNERPNLWVVNTLIEPSCLFFSFFLLYPSRLLFQFHCCLPLPNHGGIPPPSGEKPEYPE